MKATRNKIQEYVDKVNEVRRKHHLRPFCLKNTTYRSGTQNRRMYGLALQTYEGPVDAFLTNQPGEVVLHYLMGFLKGYSVLTED